MLKLLLVCAAAILVVPVIMTGSICHWGFAANWNKNGQCAASDTPSEVFLSFLSISLLIAVFIALIWFAFWFVMNFIRVGASK